MRRRLFKNLVNAPCTEPVIEKPSLALEAVGTELRGALSRRLGRSMAIREVDAGSCNGCELEIHALGNAFYDVERFGVRFVASPRHADALLVTGPVTLNMREAVERTYAAMPAPKWVIAVGDCGAGCGVFADSYACVGAVSKVIPVDLVIRGCPPSPVELLQGLLWLLNGSAAKVAPGSGRL
jgi:Ni,Fe-hydrogenase III small subunit